jgi:O-acetyl-ADP-ribose deacetylase (regulator of RNase III)
MSQQTLGEVPAMEATEPVATSEAVVTTGPEPEPEPQLEQAQPVHRKRVVAEEEEWSESESEDESDSDDDPVDPVVQFRLRLAGAGAGARRVQTQTTSVEVPAAATERQRRAPGVAELRRSELAHGASIVISAGSVLDFGGGTEWAPPTVAIVNAANCGGLGGGGVDGAITSAGGPQLAADRRALPILEGTHMDRIVTGGAVLTGPGNYGRLHGAHVIHAVGPNYLVLAGMGKSMEDGDQQLREAYRSTMRAAATANIEYLGFSLLSAGVFRGARSLEYVLRLGIEAVAESAYPGLKEAHLVAFMGDEQQVLLQLLESGAGAMTTAVQEESLQPEPQSGEDEWSDPESEDDDKDGLDPVARLRLRLIAQAATGPRRVQTQTTTAVVPQSESQPEPVGRQQSWTVTQQWESGIMEPEPMWPESRALAGAAKALTVRFADPPTTTVLRFELSEEEVQRKRAVVEEEWSDSESEDETDDRLDLVAQLRLRLAGAAAGPQPAHRH